MQRRGQPKRLRRGQRAGGYSHADRYTRTSNAHLYTPDTPHRDADPHVHAGQTSLPNAHLHPSPPPPPPTPRPMGGHFAFEPIAVKRGSRPFLPLQRLACRTSDSFRRHSPHEPPDLDHRPTIVGLANLFHFVPSLGAEIHLTVRNRNHFCAHTHLMPYRRRREMPQADFNPNRRVALRQQWINA